MFPLNFALTTSQCWTTVIEIVHRRKCCLELVLRFIVLNLKKSPLAVGWMWETLTAVSGIVCIILLLGCRQSLRLATRFECMHAQVTQINCKFDRFKGKWRWSVIDNEWCWYAVHICQQRGSYNNIAKEQHLFSACISLMGVYSHMDVCLWVVGETGMKIRWRKRLTCTEL